MSRASELLKAAVANPPGPARDTLLDHAKRADLRERIIGCTACPLHKTATSPVPFEGYRSPVAIIGEAPGATEDRLGRPFVGRAGKLLDRVLDRVGWSRSDVVFINSICCRPPSNNFDEAVKADAPSRCRPFLWEQIDISGAWILVPVGNRPMNVLLPHITAGITQMRGQLKWQDHHLVAPTYHPAYALRNPKAEESMVADLLQVHRIILGEEHAPVPKSFDPTKLLSSMRQDSFSEDDRRRFASHFKKHGWVSAYSHWVEDHIILVRDEKVIPPSHLEGVVYTVKELTQLSHMNRTWQDAVRLHSVKKELEATII